MKRLKYGNKITSKTKSTPAQQLEATLSVLKLLSHKEYRFHPTRRWRFDFAWPEVKLAVEVEGGIFINGAHTRGAHFQSDCEKYAEALVLGWRVLRVEGEMIREGRALDYIQKLLSYSNGTS
jgi:very-short-patch-repair endonuclease